MYLATVGMYLHPLRVASEEEEHPRQGEDAFGRGKDWHHELNITPNLRCTSDHYYYSRHFYNEIIYPRPELPLYQLTTSPRL